MPRPFSRTLRALDDDLRVWPLTSTLSAVVLAALWLAWFITPSVPVHVETADVTVSDFGRRLVPTGSGGGERFEPITLWRAEARLGPGRGATVQVGQPAVLWVDGVDGVPVAVAARVTSIDGGSGAVALAAEADPTTDYHLRHRPARRVWIETGLRSPLGAALAQAGAGVARPPVVRAGELR